MGAFFELAKRAHKLGATELHFKADADKMMVPPTDEGQNACPDDTWTCMAQCDRHRGKYLPEEVSHASMYKAVGRTGEEALRRVVILMEGDPPHAVRERRPAT